MQVTTGKRYVSDGAATGKWQMAAGSIRYCRYKKLCFSAQLTGFRNRYGPDIGGQKLLQTWQAIPPMLSEGRCRRASGGCRMCPAHFPCRTGDNQQILRGPCRALPVPGRKSSWCHVRLPPGRNWIRLRPPPASPGTRFM